MRVNNAAGMTSEARQNQQYDLCAQQRLRSDWADYNQSLCCALYGIAEDPMFLHADSEDWSDSTDAQADLSLRWAQMSFCWFCHEAAHMQAVFEMRVETGA